MHLYTSFSVKTAQFKLTRRIITKVVFGGVFGQVCQKYVWCHCLARYRKLKNAFRGVQFRNMQLNCILNNTCLQIKVNLHFMIVFYGQEMEPQKSIGQHRQSRFLIILFSLVEIVQQVYGDSINLNTLENIQNYSNKGIVYPLNEHCDNLNERYYRSSKETPNNITVLMIQCQKTLQRR